MENNSDNLEGLITEIFDILGSQLKDNDSCQTPIEYTKNKFLSLIHI